MNWAGYPTTYGPQIIDLCIYFYTSNGGGAVLIPNGTKIRGWGYAVSTHVSPMPLAVYVTTSYTGTYTSNDPQNYEFYVAMPYYVGNPIVTAATSGTWTPNISDGPGSSTVPTYGIQLPIASNMTSMVKTYSTVAGGPYSYPP